MIAPDLLNIRRVSAKFSSSFLPIYPEHPGLGESGICDARSQRLNEVGECFRINWRYRGIDEVLAKDPWDAVQIVIPVSMHAEEPL